MFAGVKSFIPLTKPETAAKRIISAIQTNRIMYKMPWLMNLLPFVKGILPIRLFDVIIGKGFGVYNSMKSFTGRKSD